MRWYVQVPKDKARRGEITEELSPPGGEPGGGLKYHIKDMVPSLEGVAGISGDNLRYRRAMLLNQAKQNILQLQQAKELADRKERQKNSLAVLSDHLIKDSFDSQLQSKMDLLYDNHTDLTKELKFVPAVFNCGKEFDIYKLLDLAKLHRSLTTEAPKCIEELDDPLCQSGKEGSGGASSSSSKNNEGVTRKIKNYGVPSSRNLMQMYGVGMPKGVLTVTISDKKGRARPLGKQQQQKLMNMKPLKLLDEENTHEDPAEMSELTKIISDDQLNNIIAKPVAAVRNSRIKLALGNNPVETATQFSLFGNRLPTIDQVKDQVSHVADQELKNTQNPDGIQHAAKHEASRSNVCLQQQNIGTVPQHDKQFLPATQDVEQQQQIFRVATEISQQQLPVVDDYRNRSQVVNSNGIVPPDKIYSEKSGIFANQLFELPVLVTIGSLQQLPEAINMANQSLGSPMLPQTSMQQQQAVTAVQQQHLQPAKPTMDLQQQSYQPTSPVPTIAGQQQQAIIQHPLGVKSVAAASIFPAEQTQPAKVQSHITVAQKLPDMPSINVIPIESKVNSNDTLMIKSPLEHKNVRGKSSFWSHFGHMLPNTYNSGSMEHSVNQNNKAMYVPNVHQSKVVPNKLEHNPKVDYMYYQY